MDGPLPHVFVLLLVLTSLTLARTQACGVEEDCGNGCTCVTRSYCNSTTGVCTCYTGVDGPTCNRRNVARGRPAGQSSNFRTDQFTADKAVDGITGHTFLTTRCTHTQAGGEENPFWEVTLNSTYSIYRFQIYNRNDCCGERLNGFILYVVNSSSGISRVCYKDKTTSNVSPGNIIDGVCHNSPIPGDKVRITVPGSLKTLTLCEVKVFEFISGGKRCARSKPLTSGECLAYSPTWNTPTRGHIAPADTKVCHSGERLEMFSDHPSCNTTRQRSSEDYVGGERLNGFILYVVNSSSGISRVCYKDKTTSNVSPGNIIDGVCHNSPIPGDKVRITVPGSLKTLTLCEVKVFVCTPGSYGRVCNETCGFCAGGRQVCDGTSGDCPDTDQRCMEPFAGPKCKDCSPGRYGQTCQQTCGFCADGQSVCNTTSGDCPDRSPTCAAGYIGTRCDTACSPGRYGPDCNQTCGFCDDGRTSCDSTSGHCPDKQPTCMAGYSGLKCDTECTDNRWGADCGQPCGNCYNGTACNRTSGDCPVTEGGPVCMSGYMGKACSTMEALKGVGPPPNPVVIGGSVAGSVVLVVVVVVVVIVVSRRRKGRVQKNNNQEMCQRQPEGAIIPPSYRKPEGEVYPPRDGEQEGEDCPPRDGEQGSHLGVEGDDPGDNDSDREVEPEENVHPNHMFDENLTSVPVEGFWEYVAWKKTAKKLKPEFEKFPTGLHAKYDVANKPENKLKSRYKSLVAYDHSRVILSPVADGSDYINACYIDGYDEPQKYIAAQGPNDVIVDDFMRMIWEQNTGKVVMVTNLIENRKTKCEKYWPDNGSVGFGQIDVTLQDEEPYANFIVRTLLLSNVKVKGESRTIKQFHFTGWPDHGAPSQPTEVLQFREKVNNYKTPLKGPVIIHCSAGIGRTGTFIALDYLIDQAQEEGVVDVPGCVHLLREQRVNMVQTPEQYTFLHEALAEALNLNEESIPEQEFPRVFSKLKSRNPKTGKSKMADQFEKITGDNYIRDLGVGNTSVGSDIHIPLVVHKTGSQALKKFAQPLDEASLSSARHADNLTKNRSDVILAPDPCRPYLSTPVSEGNNYINAVFLPAYKKKRGFILTQTPLPNTVVDFWRLVYDHTVSVIVMLDWVDTQDKDAGIYWPEKRKTFESFEVTVTDRVDDQDFSVWAYQLRHKKTKATHPIKHFRCNFWRGRLSAISSFLTFLQNVVTWQQQTGNEPVLVHCRDGFTKSGLYCVASAVMERLKADQEVNIVQTVRQMRVNRPEIITDLNQFQFLHEIVRQYLESAHTYANIVGGQFGEENLQSVNTYANFM